MTVEEMNELSETLTKQLEEGMDQVSVVLDVVTTQLEEHPDIVTKAGNLFVNYIDVLMPMFKQLAQATIDVRKEAFKEFRNLGLTNDQCIKMVCGR